MKSFFKLSFSAALIASSLSADPGIKARIDVPVVPDYKSFRMAFDNDYGISSSSWQLPSGGSQGIAYFYDARANTLTNQYSNNLPGLQACAINGKLALTANSLESTGTVFAFDASTQTLLGSLTAPGFIDDLEFQNGTTAWMGTRVGVIQGIDVSDPAQMRLTASITYDQLASNPIGMCSSGTILAVCGLGSNSIGILNNTTFQTIGKVRLASNAGPWQVATNGTTWACVNRSGADCVNIFNPFTQQIVGTIPNVVSPRGIAIDSNVGAFSSNDGKFYLFSPSAPYTVLGSISFSSSSFPRDVVLFGTTAYVACLGDNSIKTINISNPASPQLINSLPIPSAYGLSRDGTKMVATGINNAQAYFLTAQPGGIQYRGLVSTFLSPRTPALSATIVAIPCADSQIIDILRISDGSRLGTISNSSSYAITSGAGANLTWIASNQTQNALYQFDPYNFNRVQGVNVGPNLDLGPVFSGTTGAYVLNFGELVFFDSTNGRITGTVNPTSGVSGMTINGTSVYLSYPNTNLINQYDINSQQLIQSFTVTAPRSIGATSDTLSYVSGLNAPFILSINSLPQIENTGNLIFEEFLPGGLETLESKGYVNRFTTASGINQITCFGYDVNMPTDIQGPGAITAYQLNTMEDSGNLLAETQSQYLAALYSSDAARVILVNQASSQHKVLQYQIDKLDLLLHKDIDSLLYAKSRNTQLFLTAGYDHLRQETVKGYPGYSVDHYYQMLGSTQNFGALKLLESFAVSESYEDLLPDVFNGKATYTTLWGDFGLSYMPNRWSYGVDVLFGYSFIDAQRKIDLFGLEAKTDHGMWNISFDTKLAYSFNCGKISLTPYENLGYIYGVENDYQEHGAPGMNLSITDEKLSALRNQFGIKLVAPTDLKFKFFFDAAWLYETFFNHKNYHQRFLGSTIVVDQTQTVPTRNYGRINSGFSGNYKHVDWNVAYTGLYGKNLRDSAVSLKASYKF